MPEYPEPTPFYAVCTSNSGPNGSSGLGVNVVAVFTDPGAAQEHAEQLSSVTPFVIYYVVSPYVAYQSFISLPPEETWLGGSGS